MFLTLVNCTNMKVYCQKCKSQPGPIKSKFEKRYWMYAMQIQRQLTRTFVNHCLTYSYLYLLNQDMFNMTMFLK